jgi:hypothetical protein
MAQDVASRPNELLQNSSDLAAKQEELNILHHRLMAVYVHIIELVSGPERLPRGAEPSGRSRANNSGTGYQREILQRRLRLYKRRPITRNLVNSHIKGKLDELKAAYVRIEQITSNTDSTIGFRKWLKDTQDSLSRFSATLTVMAAARRILVALWPLIVALVVLAPVWNYVVDQLHKERSRPVGLLLVITYITLAIVYIALLISVAARKKRRLFLAPVFISPDSPSDSSTSSISRETTAKNVYEVENDLFSCISKPKRAEFALDIYAGIVMAIGWTAYSIGVVVASYKIVLWVAIEFGLFALIGVFIVVSSVVTRLRRTVK